MKYMLLIYGDPADSPAQDSPEGQAELQEWFVYTQRMQDDGAFVAGQALHPAPAATTVRERDGERVVTDGPFADTKEWLGGFYVVEVPDRETAVEWAARMPNIKHGSIEVREVMEFEGM